MAYFSNLFHFIFYFCWSSSLPPPPQPACQLAYDGKVHQLYHLLKTDASQLNVQEKNSGDTPLIAACRRGNVKVVEYLLKNGADVHLTNQVELRAIDVAGLAAFHCVFECLRVRVSETEDMSSLRLQEDILAARLPDGHHSDAHPAAWLLPHGKNKPGQGSANFLTCGPQ